jgi:hypothetical protein
VGASRESAATAQAATVLTGREGDRRLIVNTLKKSTMTNGALVPRGGPPLVSSGAAASGSTLQSLGLPGCCQHPRNEWLGRTRYAPPPVPDAARPNVEIIIADHGVREVHAVVKLQGFARIGRLSCAVAPHARCLMCLNSSPLPSRRSLRLLSCHRAVECSALPTSSTNARQHATCYERCSNRSSWPPVAWFHAECL